MPLEGIRAWIGEVERKLGMRTRVFLVLAALAIGGAGAAIYLTLETRDDAVSEGDVRALQEDLEAQIAGGGSAAGPSLGELQADLRALQAKVAALQGAGAGTSGATGPSGETAPSPEGAVPPAAGGSAEEGASSESGSPPEGRLRKFFEAGQGNEAASADAEPNGGE